LLDVILLNVLVIPAIDSVSHARHEVIYYWM